VLLSVKRELVVCFLGPLGVSCPKNKSVRLRLLQKLLDCFETLLHVSMGMFGSEARGGVKAYKSGGGTGCDYGPCDARHCEYAALHEILTMYLNAVTAMDFLTRSLPKAYSNNFIAACLYIYHLGASVAFRLDPHC
jgi:hypothetical protein